METTKQRLQVVLHETVKFFQLNSVADDLYIAGGAIRDLERDKVPADYDIYVTNKASADIVRNVISRSYVTNMNGNFKIYLPPLGVKLNIILNEEFNVSPEVLIHEFNFTCNQNFLHGDRLKLSNDIKYTELVLNPLCKYPLGCMVKVPRMLELGYTIDETFMMKLLGKVLPLNIQTQEEFKKACPNISGGLVSYVTGLPTAEQYFNSTELGKSLS